MTERRSPLGRKLAMGTAVILGLAGAAGARAESLNEALVMAYASNPELLQQRAVLRALDQGVAQAESGWRPTLTFAADGSSVKREDYSYNGTHVRDIWRQDRSVGVTLAQSVFSGFRTVSAVDQAEHQVLAGRAQLHSVEQKVLLAAITAYLDVWRDRAVVDLTRNNEQVLTRQLQASRDRFQVGEITRTDVAQSEARLAKAQADRIAAEGNLKVSRAAYQKTIGKEPEDTGRASPADGLPGDLATLLTEAAASNPDVRAADFAAQAGSDAVDLARGQLLPDVKVQASASKYNDQSYSDDSMKVYAIGATMTMPLYEGGAVYAQVRAAKDQAARARLAFEQARRQVTESGISAWESLESAKAQIAALREEVRASEIALDGVRREADVGQRTVLDVLDAEQELLDARVNLVRAERGEVVASYQVRAAIGRLTAVDLGLDTPFYDPNVHYEEASGKWIGTGVFSDAGKEGLSLRK